MIYNIKTIRYYSFLASEFPEKYDINNDYYFSDSHFSND